MKRMKTPIKALVCALAFTGAATAIGLSDTPFQSEQLVVGNDSGVFDPLSEQSWFDRMLKKFGWSGTTA